MPPWSNLPALAWDTPYGAFTVSWRPGAVRVNHGRLGRRPLPVVRRAVVARLPDVPADVFVDNDVPIEAAPSKHGIAQGFFLYGFEPGGNRIEVTTGGYFVYDPDFEPTIWTSEERARGQFWGVQTIESFHTYGTPPIGGEQP